MGRSFGDTCFGGFIFDLKRLGIRHTGRLFDWKNAYIRMVHHDVNCWPIKLHVSDADRHNSGLSFLKIQNVGTERSAIDDAIGSVTAENYPKTALPRKCRSV